MKYLQLLLITTLSITTCFSQTDIFDGFYRELDKLNGTNSFENDTKTTTLAFLYQNNSIGGYGTCKQRMSITVVETERGSLKNMYVEYGPKQYGGRQKAMVTRDGRYGYEGTYYFNAGSCKYSFEN